MLFSVTDESAISLSIAEEALNDSSSPVTTEYRNSFEASANLTYTNATMAFSAGAALLNSGKL